MNVRWAHLLIPVGGAAVAALVGSVAFWDTAKPSILTALSVIAAGVLVRLARGLPFNNADQFALDEVRQIASATKQSIRALRALIVVVFIAMAALIFAAPIAANLAIQLERFAFNPEPLVSGAIGFLLTYVFVRIYTVIKGDVSLVDLQSQLLVQSVERKQAEKFEKSQSKSGIPAMSNPEGYGKVIQ